MLDEQGQAGQGCPGQPQRLWGIETLPGHADLAKEVQGKAVWFRDNGGGGSRVLPPPILTQERLNG